MQKPSPLRQEQRHGRPALVYAPGVNRAATLELPMDESDVARGLEHDNAEEAWRDVERAEQLVSVPVVHLTPTVPTPRVPKIVQTARDHFDEIFSEFNTTLESEYDDVFEAPPASAYAEENRVHEIHPHDKLGWFYGSKPTDDSGDPPDDLGGAEFGRGPRGSKAVGFFQDARIQGRRHVPGHTLGEESRRAPWNDARAQLLHAPGAAPESEAHASYHKPPADWRPPALARVPHESIRARGALYSTKTPAPPPPPAPLDLARMRLEFHEEMSRIHNVDDDAPAVSEYDARFTAPALRSTPTSAKGAIAAEPRPPTEYQLAFRAFARDDLAVVEKTKPAGAASKRPVSARPSAAPWGRADATSAVISSSEYASSFTDLEKRRAAEAAAREAKLAREAKRAEAAKMAAAVAAKVAAKRATLRPEVSAQDLSSTEYRDRFCHGGATSVLPDPGFLSSPRKKKPEKLAEPMLSEYDHEYDHLGRPKPPARRPPAHTYTPGFITEYEGALCGYDLRQDIKAVHRELQDIEHKKALKPAYALRPERKHKHRLIDAEAARGYVPKTEHMQSFVDPRARYNQHADQFKATAQLKDAKLGAAEVVASKVSHLDKVQHELGLAAIPERPKVSHEARLEKANKDSLKWWTAEGQRLWATYNPVTLYPRWNPYGDRFKTPETEYQRAFRQAAASAAATAGEAKG